MKKFKTSKFFKKKKKRDKIFKKGLGTRGIELVLLRFLSKKKKKKIQKGPWDYGRWARTS